MGEEGEATERWTFKAIVGDGDNWERCKEVYEDELTDHQTAEVEKMLGCGNPENGFATFMCLECGETVRVSFSCKSRVCSSCGKVYADEWSRQLSGRMFNVTHRHITFTVPDELWPVLERKPEWRKEMFRAANRTLRKVMKSEPGIVMVMHPYGKDLKVNYHLHVLVTEGGINEAGEWKSQTFISYRALRKVWQYEFLTGLREVMPSTPENKRLIDRMFRKHSKGFYVHAEPRVESGDGVSRYIGRYIRHPAIADARIVAYDGETVTFYYQDRQQGRQERTLPVLEFIYNVVRHIPPKQFKMVRYYGLYAPRKASQMRAIMEKIGKAIGRFVRRLNWRERIQRDFHRDPLKCPQCGASGMVLFSLTVPWRGGQLKTIGGWKWLFERGDVKEQREVPTPVSPTQQKPQVVQLTLAI
jgi:hypothetical protein